MTEYYKPENCATGNGGNGSGTSGCCAAVFKMSFKDSGCNPRIAMTFEQDNCVKPYISMTFAGIQFKDSSAIAIGTIPIGETTTTFAAPENFTPISAMSFQYGAYVIVDIAIDDNEITATVKQPVTGEAVHIIALCTRNDLITAGI